MYDKDFQKLKKILLCCPYKLTSKDKLVATYLFLRKDIDGVRWYSDEAIAQKTGLALRTVHKSVGRLEAIGAISFLYKECFVFEELL